MNEVITGGRGVFIGAAKPASLPAGWVEEERVLAGTATAPEVGAAAFRTRVLIRRPPDFDGTLLVEWLNVSGGVDASPDYSYMEDEIVRSGHAWAGVSAQLVGVEGGIPAVAVPAGHGIAGKGLKHIDPDRYGTLEHPGDAFAYDIFTQAGVALRASLGAARVLGTGASQSAAMLVAYVNRVQPSARAFDGFLVHSRGGGAAPVGEAGAPIDVMTAMFGTPTPIAPDPDVPVLVVQTETDVVALGYAHARQDDSARVRVWEIAGAAHADRFILGPTADSLDCGGPVNDGPHQYVVRAALRALDSWVRTGEPPPRGERLELDGVEAVRDEDGIARGGIRTPMVDVPVSALSGAPRPGASIICFLSGSSDPLPPERLAARYESRAAYLDAFAKATDAAIARGFVLPEDRALLLAEARPESIS